MTICALLLSRQFYDLQPSTRLKYATVGLLFVSVSIGGTLTHFAAPPVLMVARPWGWDTAFMLTHFGFRAVISIVASTAMYFLLFRRELRAMATLAAVPDIEQPDDEAGAHALLPVPGWVTAVHIGFIAWTVSTHTIGRSLSAVFSSSWDSPGPRRRIRAESSSGHLCSWASSWPAW